jgi:DNA adenine methylase
MSQQPKPFLKWVGGKHSILPQLISRLPKEYDEYYEPFVGGGALFFAVQPKNAHLSDVNFDLIITYITVRDDVDKLIDRLKVHEFNHDKTYFLNTRERLFVSTNHVETASLFIYLNKTCFNGLYRVNKQGKFNVPIGNYKEPNIVDEDVLMADYFALQGVNIKQSDFTLTPVHKNAFYYFDPPFHQTYDNYSASGFDGYVHIKLADLCHKINKAGGKFMVSNSDTEFVRDLYKNYNIEVIKSSRSVSCKSNQRGKVQELIIRNYT